MFDPTKSLFSNSILQRSDSSYFSRVIIQSGLVKMMGAICSKRRCQNFNLENFSQALRVKKTFDTRDGPLLRKRYNSLLGRYNGQEKYICLNNKVLAATNDETNLFNKKKRFQWGKEVGEIVAGDAKKSIPLMSKGKNTNWPSLWLQ